MACADTLLNKALMLVVPWVNPVERPAAEIVATAVLEDAQVTLDVMFFVLPSEYVPVAVN